MGPGVFDAREFSAPDCRVASKSNSVQSFIPANAKNLAIKPQMFRVSLALRCVGATPPATLAALWEARTPSNVRELEAQSTLIRERVCKHKSSSPASIIEAIDQLKKGAEVMMLSA
jgi:hypothetical protein